MVSQASQRQWGNVVMRLALAPVLAIGSAAVAQTPGPLKPIAAVRDVDPAPVKGSTDVETVRQLVKQGREALGAGDRAKAEKLARQAQAMKVALPFWEVDTPEKLLIDIGVTGARPKSMPAVKADPKTLMRMANDALKAGKLDEAQRYAQQASAANANWGLFEKSPSKLLDEIQAAKAKKNRDESIKVLTDGRRLYEQGKYDEAEKLAYKSQNLHGPYSVWDMGDRADKLIADIQTAKDRNRKAKLPPKPGTKAAGDAVAKANPAKPGTKAAGDAVAKANSTKTGAPNPLWPTETKKDAPGMVPAAAASGVQTASASSPAPGEKATAMKLMAEGKSCQQAGKYVEARAKFMEAKKLNVEYTADEERPDRCAMDLSAAVVKYCDGVCKDASKPVTTPEEMVKSEAKLAQARAVAVHFGLDCQPLDAKLAWVKQVRGGDRSTNPAPLAPVPIIPAAATVAAAAPAARAIPSAIPQAPAMPPAVAAAPAAKATPMVNNMIQGQAILEKARLELKRGQAEMARQLATEVYNGPYGIQPEAAQVLRTIDVEEHNQRVLAANRSYDAGLAAYRAKEYGQTAAIFRQVDSNLLSPDKKQQFKEVLLACQKMEEGTTVAKAQAPAAPSPAKPAVVTAGMTGGNMGPVTQTAASNPVGGLLGAPPAMTPAAQSGDTLASQVEAMQQIEYQRLRAEGLDAQSKATAMFERGETDQALELLATCNTKIKGSKIDSASHARLKKPIDLRIQQFKLLKAQKDLEQNVVRKKDQILGEMNKEQLATLKQQQQVKDLMKQFNQLYKEGKYDQAKLVAEKAKELDPDDVGVHAACELAKVHSAINDYDGIEKRKEDMVRRGLNGAEDPGSFVDTNHPVSLDMAVMKIANNRKNGAKGYELKSYSDKEKELQSRLMKQVDLNFNNVPLRNAIEHLRSVSGMNIVPELAALQAESVSLEQPINLRVDNISLKSALNLMLGQAHLTYVIQDEVLKITTEKAARGKLVQKVYSVADLVIPIDDYMIPATGSLQQTIDRVTEAQRLSSPSGRPFDNGRNFLPNGQQVGSSNTNTLTTSPSGANSLSTQASGSAMSHSAYVTPTKQTMQDILIKLVQNTISPQSWSDVGGPGTIEYMPIGLAMVINQTPDVQEQVAELLEALRRLQDLEVAVEVKIITLAETFFERVGVDFSLNLKTDKSTRQYEPQLTTNQFKPAGQVNDFSPSRFLAGTTPAGNFTGDLDIPIKSSSFQYAIPPFAYPNNPGFNGGLSLGLAFLSDIQVFMFMEAAQGDRRTNVMQAPKLTLFNGQTSTISVTDNQFFVTNVNVIGFGGQIVFAPMNSAFPLGVNLAIQAVVSADRRFVRLNLTPSLTNLASAIVPLFPVTTFITPVFEGGAQGQPIPFTQFVQQPQFASVNIQTTVSIPDGGTVILGGLKTMSEGRNEFGPPVLSKLPYVNRLFRNVGYGREAQSMLLMVTPRVIINSEEEERQTGVSAEAGTTRAP